MPGTRHISIETRGGFLRAHMHNPIDILNVAFRGAQIHFAALEDSIGGTPVIRITNQTVLRTSLPTFREDTAKRLGRVFEGFGFAGQPGSKNPAVLVTISPDAPGNDILGRKWTVYLFNARKAGLDKKLADLQKALRTEFLEKPARITPPGQLPQVLQLSNRRPKAAAYSKPRKKCALAATFSGCADEILSHGQISHLVRQVMDGVHRHQPLPALIDELKDHADADMVDRLYWILDFKRMQDLDAGAMLRLRNCAQLDMSAHNYAALRHLPQQRLGHLIDALARSPQFGPLGRRVADPEQFAIMIHMCRLGASYKVCETAFTTPMPLSVVRDMRHIFLGFYHLPPGVNGWSWKNADDNTILAKSNSVQSGKQVLQP